MRTLFCLSILLVLSLTSAQWWQTDTPPVVPSAQAPAGQLRGLWVDAFGPGFKTPTEIDALIAHARALNLNTLFVQVVRRGDCYCLLSSLPVTDDPALTPGFDPLETLLERAHAAGLQVHAWVITLALWSGENSPTAPEHAYNLHGPGVGDADSWLTMRYDGALRPEEDVYLDPGVPAVSDYLTDAVVSLVRNYDIDGLVFDRLRYPDYNLGGAPSWGYNATSLARFASQTGSSALPHPTDPLWTAWRREQLSLLARRLYLAVKEVDPELWVGAATIVYGAPPQDFRDSPAYSLVLQDWAGWLAGGFLDLNIPMNYKQNGDTDEAEWFSAWNRYAPTLARGALTVVAAGIYRNDPEETEAQLGAVVADAALAGWSGYSYRTPSEGVDAGLEDSSTVLTELASLLTAPDAPFAAPETFGRPPPVTGLVGQVEIDADAPPPTVELLKAGRVVATAKVDAGGRYGFVLDELPVAAAYQVRLTDSVRVPVQVPLGRVTQAPTLTSTWYLADHTRGTEPN